MRRFTPLILMLCLLGCAVQRVAAFSLLGPSTTWMTVRLGYDVNTHVWPPGQGAPGGGPMNLGEEFRYNIPSLTYGFSPSFLNYFGQRGVLEIEKAFSILNEIPSADVININDYPLNSQRVNHRAQNLLLSDIRSMALSVVLNQMGLADPTRFVFTLRNRWTGEGFTNFFVIRRNFDPDTWQHSPFINGQLWTYTTISDGDTRSIVASQPVDPLALGGLINAPVASGAAGNSLLLFGGFWTGLTRDDVGGLRYIYRRTNYNLESAPTNSFRAGFGAPVAGGSSSPWTIPVFGTNVGGAIPGTSTNFVNLSIRPGIGSVRFVRLPAESIFGQFVSNTISYVDRFITNGVEFQQTLVRSQTAPDILFDAGDLQGGDGDDSFTIYTAGADAWIPSPAADGITVIGPGTISPGTGAGPGFSFTFNTVGPTTSNGIIGGQPFLSEVAGSPVFRWGSFDGSTDEPFIYPFNTSIEELEQLVRGGGGAGGVGGFGSLVDIWSPASIVLLPPGSLDGVIGGGAGDGGIGGGGDVGGGDVGGGF